MASLVPDSVHWKAYNVGALFTLFVVLRRSGVPYVRYVVRRNTPIGLCSFFIIAFSLFCWHSLPARLLPASEVATSVMIAPAQKLYFGSGPNRFRSRWRWPYFEWRTSFCWTSQIGRYWLRPASLVMAVDTFYFSFSACACCFFRINARAGSCVEAWISRLGVSCSAGGVLVVGFWKPFSFVCVSCILFRWR